MKRVILIAAIAAAAHPAGGGPPIAQPAKVRFHMHRHVDDLREVQRLLLAGKLDEAKTRAFLLTKPASDAGLAAWRSHAARLSDSARALTQATTIAEACRLEAQVAAACATCHVRAEPLAVIYPPAPAAPANAATVDARMARHQWAADRLWEGMIAGTTVPWRQGLEVLAQTPLPFPPHAKMPALADRLQDLARGALESLSDRSETIDTRATTYGNMLVTCAACHQAARSVVTR